MLGYLTSKTILYKHLIGHIFAGVDDKFPEAGPARRDGEAGAGARRVLSRLHQLHQVQARRRDVLRSQPGYRPRFTGTVN